MSTTSNLYADKILSEHPLAVWALDDTSDYISLISDSFRNINSWNITNGSKSAVSLSPTAPFPSSYITQVTGAGSAGTTTLTSNTTFSSDAGGFTVSFYIQTGVDTTIKVGYTGITSQEKVVYGAEYPTLTWIPVSFTFSNQATTKNLKIELVYGSASPVYYINGLTIGKNSEPFNGESFGQSLITIPSTIATTQTSGIESKSYGTEDYSAYYIGSGKDLYARNCGMSMSYGSGSSMIVYPHATSGQPSFIFPGLGFLNEIGRYKELTLEMFIRINADNSSPKRIIGPLASTDGVYVTKEFISLKVGDTIGSFYLSELYRPILLQVKIGENYAILNIDGEDVISLQTQTSTLSLPALLDGSSKNQDWLGLFAYSDIKFIEVDSIAIYPYRCSSVLAKTRLAYAQAVDVPLEINLKYGGNVILADYGFANYTNNYNYPSFQAKWEQASIRDNFDVSPTQTLLAKQYSAPQLSSSLYSSSILLQDLYTTNVASGESNTFINLKPGTVVSGSGRSWSTNQGYLYSSSFNKNEHLSNCIYGVFKSLESSGTEQVLLQILNESTNDYLKISITNTTVSYKLMYQSVESTITTKSITQNQLFAVGIDVKTLSTLNPDVSEFFTNTDSLNIYVGGYNLANTFSGNIYKVGLCSSRNFESISSLFTSGILTNISSHSVLLPRTASYTIVGVNAYSKIILDIATNAYWQDYVPLNKLSKTIDNLSGNPVQELDFIQINADYPETRTYSSGNFDTSSSELKTYITFQTSASGTVKQLSEFSTTVLPNENRVIDATTFSATTKYEFVNSMIIYPPTDVDFTTLNLVVHMELNTNAINLKPYDVRSLQVAAKTLEYATAESPEPNPIGTKYSINLHPYIYDGTSYDHKSVNPYLIYKQSSPYLYLTRHTGVRFCGDYDSGIDRGVYFEIGNPSLSIKINSLQMSILADIKEFPTTAIKIFEIVSKSETISFYLKNLNSSQTKGYIYTDSTSNIPIYYLNGKVVANPVLELDEWNILGLSFLNPIDLSDSVGKVKITSNILFDNISYYGLDTVNNSQKISILTWDVVDNAAWNALGTWKYSGLSDYYKIYDNGVKDIYKTYTGTNKILADTSSNTHNLKFNGYKYIGYMDIEKNTVILDIV
jgi:hypothetical protein